MRRFVQPRGVPWLLAALIGLAVAPSGAAASPAITVLQTRSGSSGPKPLPDLHFTAAPASPPDGVAQLLVDDSRRLQPIWGVGATVTNSSAFLVEHALSAPARAGLLAALFAPGAAHLGWVGTTIGGSDFNAGGARYSEDDRPAGQSDPGLRHFSLGRDQDTIALLRSALAINPAIRVFARPWTAPAWMKANHSLTNLHYAGVLEPRWYATYARYLVAYVRGFARAGIPIFAITVENEPKDVPAGYEGMNLSALAEARLIHQYVIPALRRAGFATRVLALDESWDEAAYARTAAPSAQGIAWHCYAGDPDAVMPQFAGLSQVVTECASNLIHARPAALLADVFGDGASAAALWNLALDPAGGPVVVPNTACGGCRGLVAVDPGTHAVALSNDYAMLAQYGRYLTPGATRIAATRFGFFLPVTGTDRATRGLHDVAFRNPDGSLVLVLYDNDGQAAGLTVRWRGLAAPVTVPGRATVTLRWAGPS